jgi:hypothetical protein
MPKWLAAVEAVMILALEVLALLAIAAGATLGLEPVIGGASLTAGGLVVIGGVLLSVWLTGPRKPRRR